MLQHYKGYRKSVDGGGSGLFVMAFYAGGLCLVVDFYRLMISITFNSLRVDCAVVKGLEKTVFNYICPGG